MADRPRRLRRWWLDRSVRAKGLIVIAIPLAALLGTTSASLALQRSEGQQRLRAATSTNLGNTANAVLVDALNAETGVRGYAVTGDPLFLAPYDLMLTRIGAERRSLDDDAIAEGNIRSEQLADVALGAVLGDLAHLRSAISRGPSSKEIAPALKTGKLAMDLLRRRIAGIGGGSARLAAGQRGRIGRLETAITALNVAGLLIGLLAGLAGVALFTSGISRRVAAAAVNASLLGQGEPLRPTSRSHDELGHLADSLAQAEQLLVSRAAELTTARDDAMNASKAKDLLLSRTSHELRTPLNSVLGFTQLLQMSDLSGEDNDCVERILAAGRHLLTLINELIDFARIESGDISLSIEPVAILPLIEEVSDLMGPLAAERSIAIIHRCGHPGLAARADRQRLSQVLVNLMSNAVKYNRRGGTMTITWQKDGDGRASVVVSDTGPGLSKENLERVFVSFERLGAEQTGVEGTGIGLSLARTLTEAMGGRLTASSVPGEGSAFTVSLPGAPDMIHIASRDTAPESPPVPHAPAKAAINILYIEDNPANVEVVRRFLKARPNMTLRAVASGRDGVQCAVRDIPDIILLDLHLPDLPGDRVLKELRAEPVTAAIPVAVLSAEANTRTIRRLLASGALAYLTKPLDLAELGALLDSLVPPARDSPADPPTRATPA